jgi:large subunit ribosomal protein L24e
MLKCSYCDKDYDSHKGLIFVLKDGNIKNFCSSKCRKNMQMKRRKVRWISKDKKVDNKKISIKK